MDSDNNNFGTGISGDDYLDRLSSDSISEEPAGADFGKTFDFFGEDEKISRKQERPQNVNGKNDAFEDIYSFSSDEHKGDISFSKRDGEAERGIPIQRSKKYDVDDFYSGPPIESAAQRKYNIDAFYKDAAADGSVQPQNRQAPAQQRPSQNRAPAQQNRQAPAQQRAPQTPASRAVRSPSEPPKAPPYKGAQQNRNNASAQTKEKEMKRQNTEVVKDEDEISDFESRHRKVAARSGNTAIPKQENKHRAAPVWAAVIAVILIIVIGIGAAGIGTVGSVASKFTKAEKIEHIDDASLLRTQAGVRNILLIGLDKSKGGSSRSDSIMIASVNKNTGKIILTSILRDTHVAVPGHQESKINAAFAWGEANLLIQTIEQNFGIKIDDYALVNFDMFTDLIDGLGGIDIEVTEKEANWMNYKQNYHKSKHPDPVDFGESVHLTGYQALWYSRIRYLDSDFMRTYRQRKVMTAIMNKVKANITPSGMFKLLETAKDVAGYITTTLSSADLTELGFALAGCLSKSNFKVDSLLMTERIPFDNTWHYSNQWDGSSISIDLEKNKELLQEAIFDKDWSGVTNVDPEEK